MRRFGRYGRPGGRTGGGPIGGGGQAGGAGTRRRRRRGPRGDGCLDAARGLQQPDRHHAPSGGFARAGDPVRPDPSAAVGADPRRRARHRSFPTKHLVYMLLAAIILHTHFGVGYRFAAEPFVDPSAEASGRRSPREPRPGRRLHAPGVEPRAHDASLGAGSRLGLWCRGRERRPVARTAAVAAAAASRCERGRRPQCRDRPRAGGRRGLPAGRGRRGGGHRRGLSTLILASFVWLAVGSTGAPVRPRRPGRPLAGPAVRRDAVVIFAMAARPRLLDRARARSSGWP